MDTLQVQLAIASFINALVHLIVLTASIIIFIKSRSVASIFLLIGSLLSGIGLVGGALYNAWAAQKGTKALLDAQVVLAFFNAFAFLVFGIGLLVLALSFYKKNQS